MPTLFCIIFTMPFRKLYGLFCHGPNTRNNSVSNKFIISNNAVGIRMTIITINVGINITSFTVSFFSLMTKFLTSSGTVFILSSAVPL